MATFIDRHVGPSQRDINHMLQTVGVQSLDELIEECVPQKIRTATPLNLPPAKSEQESLEIMNSYAQKNKIWRSYIGLGYHNTITPSVILRNLLENPGWYTSYTPYQAEISQGRLEALLIFQTMVQDLTGMGLSNSSLLDEATAAAEAMTMAHRFTKGKRGNRIFVSNLCHAHSIALLKTRAQPIDIEVVIGDHRTVDITDGFYAAIVQYPDTEGSVHDYKELFAKLHQNNGIAIVATDIMALTKLTPPGEFGADIVIGNTQRFGVPLGYGGPHAAFLATHDDKKWARHMPGRIIGVSTDADGNKALRMALQVREQHIKRQKATSNICTAQALLANVASMYAVWHGPEGLLKMANRMHCHILTLAQSLRKAGYKVNDNVVFDSITIVVDEEQRQIIQARAMQKEINYRYGQNSITIAFDETTSAEDVADVCETFACSVVEDINSTNAIADSSFDRKSPFLEHSIFHAHRSETEMMRYLHYLEMKDLALNKAMIPLGSCTMKLNAATEMIPITWSGFGGIHPYAPQDQALGYAQLFDDLELWLADITGFDAISLQPNAGSQGEYAGLLSIRQYHESRDESHRNICLIPTSAHGTNPASAVMAGMKVVAVKCDEDGNIDLEDLNRLALEHRDNLAALMVTYPSTHGVFEETIIDVCQLIHDNGGQVYMDGANMNAIVGLCRPGEIGADVCHLNLHKTFCIPHGGGGPGMGPIGVKAHLAPFLPRNPLSEEGGAPVSAAPYGSPSILPISWSYIAMCGREGLTYATKIAILSANYIATRLQNAYPILYTGNNGRIAHECILDVRHFVKSSHVSVEDIAKRLIDFGFHAPTMSWPVTGTLMVEPTESEPLKELDRFVDAMLSIRREISQIELGDMDYENSTLKNAPHTANLLMTDNWPFSYSREQAVFPTEHTKLQKYWPSVRRVDNTYGDKNLACSCQAWMPEGMAAK